MNNFTLSHFVSDVLEYEKGSLLTIQCQVYFSSICYSWNLIRGNIQLRNWIESVPFYCLSMMLVLTIHRHQGFTDNFIIELISGHSSWESYKHLQSSGWERRRRADRGRVCVRMSAGQSSGGSSQCRSRDVNYQPYLCFISIIT